MKNNITKALSDISRTNQLKIVDGQDIAKKLYQYLFKQDRGIESFVLDYKPTKDKNSNNRFYEERHRYIKQEIKQRLSKYGKEIPYSEIQYFLSYSDGKYYVFFLSKNKTHSGWKKLFKKNRERIFNLVFKFYLSSQAFDSETIKGFEELLFVHSKTQNKAKNALFVWGQNLLVKYNHKNVLTLTLTRKHRKFLQKDKPKITDGEDLGELLTYTSKNKNKTKKNYYYDRDLDARKSKKISFMDFQIDKKDKYDRFKKTQVYYYQNLMTKLESFLTECKIDFEKLDFQTDHYLEKAFIDNIESVESLEIINNTQIDLTQSDRQFMENFLKHQGISNLTFYNSGKSINTYQLIEEEDNPYWKITEVVPRSNIKLDKEKNYLVLNQILEEQTKSMAYQGDDGFWYPSTDIEDRKNIDFYSQLKKESNYLETGEFFSTQGMDISEFKILATKESLMTYEDKKIDPDELRLDTKAFTDGKFLDVEESIYCYLSKQQDKKEWDKFWKKYKIKISPEFQKILIELAIKNWMRKEILNSSSGLPIVNQSFSEKSFYTIYVRSPRKKKQKAVAIEFIYKENRIYIKNIIYDLKEIKNKFPFLKKRKNSEDLINNQQYFVDESEETYISCYTDDYFTPTLIGRNGIIEELENGTLEISREVKGENSSRLLPLINYYNGEIKPCNRIQQFICLDLYNPDFIQYYVPPGKNIDRNIKTGFRVYHLIGKTYSGEGKTYSEETISTSKLIDNPITAILFSTLTKDILKIGDNSQSSLLQKIAKVLIEN